MADHIRTGEAWFGDSFDRNIALGPGELSFTVNNCAVNADVLKELTGYCNSGTYAMIADCTKGLDSTAYTLANCDSIKGMVGINAVDSLKDRLDVVVAQVDALKQNFVPKTGAYELRSALKDLYYRHDAIC